MHQSENCLLKELQLHLCNMNESLVGTLIGGGVTLAGTLLAAYLQRAEAREKSREDERGLLASIRCEITVLLKLMQARHDAILLEKFCEDGYIKASYSIGLNYFAFFDSNSSNMMKIIDENLRLQIQETIVYGKSYIDSLKTHCEGFGSVCQLEALLKRHPGDQLLSEQLTETRTELIRFDKEALIPQAKDLEQRLKSLLLDLRAY